uniref:Uncharacterized protein n=1 Tax=Anguilla anguilla TaxID=7936 RepID=A0A0E9WFL3_ANGAN
MYFVKIIDFTVKGLNVL